MHPTYCQKCDYRNAALIFSNTPARGTTLSPLHGIEVGVQVSGAGLR
jgi:hypothetical protein